MYEGVFNTIDYYETVERTMGGRAQTQDFFRLFVVPGMNHCSGGDGPHVIDYLTYLENWVERGKAPDKMTGYHPNSRTSVDGFGIAPLDKGDAIFSRPIYPYPIEATYTGNGDPNAASNFKSLTR